jgi:hypothetical protein
MTINKPSFSSASAEQQSKLVIKMLSRRPALLERLAEPVTPFEIAGYYDRGFNVVEMFMASPDGTYWMRIGS